MSKGWKKGPFGQYYNWKKVFSGKGYGSICNDEYGYTWDVYLYTGEWDEEEGLDNMGW